MKSIIITGANIGIAYECALQIAKDEPVILVCRDVAKTHVCLAKITDQK